MIQVSTTARAVAASLVEFATDQLPFAVALALTKTGNEAAAAARADLPKAFTLRNSWLARQYRSTRAEKKDWPRTSVKVGTLAEFLVLHEVGGVKRPRDGRSIAIPTRAVRRSKAGRIGKANRPKALLDKPGVRKTEEAIVRKTTKKNQLGTLYLLREGVRIRPRLRFRRTVERTFAERWNVNLQAALETATRGRRSPADRAAAQARAGRGGR